jgi:hypothetical protein
MEHKKFIIKKIQDYRQGIKTIHEIKKELADIPELQYIPDSIELPNLLLRHVKLSAFNCPELYDLPDSIATRKGLIHLLNSYLKGETNDTEIKDWAENQLCWEMGDEQDDALIDTIVNEFSLHKDYIKEYLKPTVIKRFISLLKRNEPEEVEHVLCILSYEKVQQEFADVLADYKKGKTDRFNIFLDEKFDSILDDFPLMPQIKTCFSDKQKNIALIEDLIAGNI